MYRLLPHHHLQNLQHLLLLLQGHRIRLAPAVVQTVLRQHVELVPADMDVFQGARHAQLADHRVQDVAQVRRVGVDAARLQHLGDDGAGGQELVHTLLTGHVGVLGGVEFADGWEQDTTRFAVANSQGAQLGEISVRDGKWMDG